TGVLIGTTISLILIVMIWKPYFIYKKGFKRGISEYVTGFLKLLLSAILTLILVNYLSGQFYNVVIQNWIQWSLVGLKIITLTAVINFIIMYILNIGFRDVVKRMINLIKK